MMRWNSTKTYTEEDILRMQQEAVTRVHEFQSRAKALPFYDVPESAITPYREPDAEQAPNEAPEPETQPEPEMERPPEPVSEPAVQPSETAQQPQPNPFNYASGMPAPMPHQPTDPITGILSKLNLDGETLLILGLMFLLYNEKADNVLLIALAYLLL